MKIISFAHTTPALLAGVKTVTRRDWAGRTARGFAKGDIVQAYDKSPRNGGRRVGLIRITARPVLQSLADMPDTDYEAEGFGYLIRNGLPLPAANVWGFTTYPAKPFSPAWFSIAQTQTHIALWVVRFDLVEVSQ